MKPNLMDVIPKFVIIFFSTVPYSYKRINAFLACQWTITHTWSQMAAYLFLKEAS